MDVRFLKTLHLIAELGSMAQAARRLEISPAAVAHQLRALESDVGATLVKRSGRTVSPTAAGHRLLAGTRSVLAQLDAARASVHGPGMAGELRIGAINTALHTLLPTVMARYAANFPDVKLQVHADVSSALMHQLQEGLIDLAICQHPPFDLPKTFHWQFLREEPLVVLAHTSHQHHSPRELLMDQRFIRYDRRTAGGAQADAYLRQQGIAVRDVWELDSLLAIALMVHQRLGVSLVPRFESLLTAALHITTLSLPHTPSARRFGLLWKNASAKTPLIEPLALYAHEIATQP